MKDVSGIKIDVNNIIKPAFDFFGKFVDLIPNKNKQAEFVAEAQRLEYDAQNKLNELEKTIQEQISERHKSDMMSDSWLSKNIRPIALIFLTSWLIVVFILAYIGIKTDPSLVGILESLLKATFQFYFGGRTIEKGASMIATAMDKRNKKK